MSGASRIVSGAAPAPSALRVEEREPGSAPGPSAGFGLFVLGVTILFTVLCTAPYVLAAWRTPSGYRFNGVLLNHFDQNYYQAAQRSAARSLPQANRFTSEAEAPGPISPLYPLAGRAQRLTGLPASIVYHFPRVLAAGVLPVLLAYLYNLCFRHHQERTRWALLFALFTTGVMTFVPGLPLATRSGERIHESNVLYSMTVFPHFAISYVGITLAFTSVSMALRGRRLRLVSAVAAAAGVLLTLGHPFLLLPFLAVVSGFLVAQGLRALAGGGHAPAAALAAAALAGCAPASAVLYNLRAEQARLERLQGFAFPTHMSDKWWTWAIGYGIVSVFVIPGALHLLRASRRDPLTWLLFSWIGAQVLFMYLPYTVFQRRFSEGLILPLAAVAGAGAAVVLVRCRSSGTSWFRGGIVALLVLGAVLAVNSLGSSGQYVSDEVMELTSMVRSHDVVLAGDTLSALLPAISDGTAYAARPFETIQYGRKREEADRYAQNPSDDNSRQWLRREGITMVIVSDKDKSFAPQGLDDSAAACLRVIFKGRDLKAYRSQPGCITSISP